MKVESDFWLMRGYYDEDVNFRDEIQKWLDDDSMGKYDFVNISVSSAYYKRLLHQTLPNMFPDLIIRTSKRHFIQIVKNTEKLRNTLDEVRRKRFEKRLAEAIGLRKVIDMISESGKVIVGHNIFQDLMFIWSQFIGQLPETLPDFIEEISKAFPM
jgi:poly(A)-specific ribonuclease